MALKMMILFRTPANDKESTTFKFLRFDSAYSYSDLNSTATRMIERKWAAPRHTVCCRGGIANVTQADANSTFVQVFKLLLTYIVTPPGRVTKPGPDTESYAA